MTGRLPDFVVIGAPRSGTTALAWYLRAHPDLFLAKEKEVRFFDQRYRLGVDWYMRRFADGRHRKVVGEATPTYMYNPTAVARMAEVIPEARLLAILRAPVDRAYSHYWMMRSLGMESQEFEEALDEEEAGLRPPGSPLAYVDSGRYHRYLEEVCARFPKGALRVLIFEDLVRDPEAVYRQTCQFLGIDERLALPRAGRRVNGAVTYRSQALRRVSKALPTMPNRIVARLNARPFEYPPRSAPAPQADGRVRQRQRGALVVARS